MMKKLSMYLSVWNISSYCLNIQAMVILLGRRLTR